MRGPWRTGEQRLEALVLAVLRPVGADLLDRAAPSLQESAPACYHQGLPERMGVPCRARTWFERDEGA